jgi:hypothetical protein
MTQGCWTSEGKCTFRGFLIAFLEPVIRNQLIANICELMCPIFGDISLNLANS